MNIFSRSQQATDASETASPSAETARSALVIGEALIDVVHRADGSVDEHPGGSPANVALTLGRLDRTVQLLTWIGEDAYGQMIRNWLSGSQVELDPISTGAPQTSIATATLDETGAATYEFEIEWLLPQAAQVPADAIVVHSGSIAATLAPGADSVLGLLSDARATASITYDPNIRPSLMGAPEQARERIEKLVALADVVKVSDEDLEWLYPKRTPDDSARAWHEATNAMIVFTRGGSGASAWTSNGLINAEAPRVAVVDTVGAGDSFMGALIDGLWQAELLGADKREALRAIDPAVTTRVLEQCVQVAAITVSRAGANPPRRAELNQSTGLNQNAELNENTVQPLR